ncbi:MAG: DUF86 domain-containing protein [Sedimentisphaerales bacterium]|jgi:uncharacterized protein with HEPN domain|nr:DUF86 domain-containing protein [Sedimentisphaerales bacterium]HNY78640.1 DUF86 domain-containing protein [Sedimentisphaerales bacterium]HOC64304.1 DUF86 domain-containing protein [Sedimentisphaerales bacterium]HOH64622.1 DUF86 domain-containing protein [Sedimentisphaerales bacterium]HPY51048.1 DUF86 domain-containing protein [Sedimentisphaerales bacterium]
MDSDLTYLCHIRDAIEKIERYIAQTDYEAFCTNDMMIDAVVRELEIIGEAAKHLSDAFVSQHGDVPWHRIKAMRNVLIHEYFGVVLKVVWDTCRSNLPILKGFIQRVLADQP